MHMLQCAEKTFSQLTTEALFDILKLRVDVFVVEQQCAYHELDEFDRHLETRHLAGRNDVGELIVYARLLPPGLRYAEANLGRFVVRADFRKQGIGHQLMENSLQEMSSCWPKSSIRISAQEYLQRFYSRYGFIQVSDVYLEDGISHIEMLKEV